MKRGTAAPCLQTIYAPDPQDCGDPVFAVLDGVPLCRFHHSAALWVGTHQGE